MSQCVQDLMEEMKQLLDRISDSGIEVPQPVRDGVHASGVADARARRAHATHPQKLERDNKTL